jgi:hypothetical protein
MMPPLSFTGGAAGPATSGLDGSGWSVSLGSGMSTKTAALMLGAAVLLLVLWKRLG